MLFLSAPEPPPEVLLLKLSLKSSSSNLKLSLDFEEDFEDDFEEEVYNLESIDVIEEKDGITISDIFDGNNLFINDDDLVYLYEILKERLISKY